MKHAEHKINALIEVLGSKPIIVVGPSKAREIAKVMMAVVSDCREDIGNDYVWRMELEGVGVLRLLVPKEQWRRNKQGCVVAFEEFSGGEVAHYIDMLNTPPKPERRQRRLRPHQSLQMQVMRRRHQNAKLNKYRGYRSC